MMHRNPVRLIMRLIATFAAAALVSSMAGSAALAQGAPQTVGLMKVDPSTVATGFRASKVIGTDVVNNQNETVGKIEDLILTGNERVPYVVLSVGGFLGIGTKYVLEPFNALNINSQRILLPGATKSALEAQPPFKFNANA
jgi:hypothetical protein